MRITVFTQAGGEGKSTISLNLLYTLKEAGIPDVKIVTNEQSHGLQNLLSPDEFIVIPERGAKLPPLPDGGVLIFDFAGKTDERIKQAVTMSRHVLVPTKGESNNKIEQFTATVDDLSDFTDKITIIISEFKKAKKSRLLTQAQDYLLKYPTYPIKESEAFRNLWEEGRSVRAMCADGGLNLRNYGEANTMFNNLVKHLFKKEG
jgi:cellulose biosynthesis protein BcsQ